MKNKLFIQGLILAVGQICGKIFSLMFIFLLAQRLKSIGLYLYTYAYIPFSLFLDLSSFGIIPGVSRTISKLVAKNENQKTIFILRYGTILMIILGVFFFIIINIFSQNILKATLYMGHTEDEYVLILNNLKIASLSLLVFPLLSFYKGFLQGYFKMLPSSLAIILESFIRVVLFILVSRNVDYSVFSSIFIINFISYILALYLLFCFIYPYYFKKNLKCRFISLLYKSIIPFGTATLFFTIYQLIDSITMSKIDPHIYTTYMFEAIRLIFIPIVVCQSIGGVITPKINYLYASGEIEEAKKIARKITNLAIIILIPVIYIFMNYSKEIYVIFYNEGDYNVLKNTAILIFFIGFYKILIGLSQGMPKFELVIAVTIISSISKLILNIILVPSYNYYGAIIATMVAIFITIIFSYISLYRGKINILLSNFIHLLSSIVILVIAIFFASIIYTVYMNIFNIYLEILINICFILLFYILFFIFIKLSTKLKCLHKMK